MNPTKENSKLRIGDRIVLKERRVDTTSGKLYEIHHIHPSECHRPYCFVDDAGDDCYVSANEVTLIAANNVVENTILSKISEFQNRLKVIDTEREAVIKNISKLQDALEILS